MSDGIICRYKLGFRPLEWFAEVRWRRLEAGEPITAAMPTEPLPVG